MTAPANDGSVLDDDLLYRRVHHRMWTGTGTTRRPSSAAFKPNHQDEGELSVYLNSALGALAPADCLGSSAEHSVVALGCQAVRGSGHGVIRDPVVHGPQDIAAKPNPCDAAHALITGFAAGKERGRQARALALHARPI